jgi:hypothetical protein
VADDPERLIAEALRAQAARTPVPTASSSAEATQVNAAPGLGLAGSGYGLLSGRDLVPTTPAETARVGAGATSRIERPRRFPIVAVLVLAVVLGLAAGAVVGLLTLL